MFNKIKQFEKILLPISVVSIIVSAVIIGQNSMFGDMLAQIISPTLTPQISYFTSNPTKAVTGGSVQLSLSNRAPLDASHA